VCQALKQQMQPGFNAPGDIRECADVKNRHGLLHLWQASLMHQTNSQQFASGLSLRGLICDVNKT
jgi:hypothetical protein